MDEVTEQLTYYKDATNSATLEVLPIAYLLTDDSDVPVTGTVTEAEFRIIATDPNTGKQSRKVRKTLGDAQLTWNASTGALTGSIFNADVTFINDDGEYHYHCFIVLDGITYDVAHGPLAAERVD